MEKPAVIQTLTEVFESTLTINLLFTDHCLTTLVIISIKSIFQLLARSGI